MLFRNQSGRQPWWPTAGVLFFALGWAGSLGWATSPEAPRACPSQSDHDAGKQRDANFGIKKPGSDDAEEGRAQERGVVSGSLCLSYLAQNLVSDEKKIWTAPLHLRALNTEDRKWFAVFGVGTLGLEAADKTIMRQLGSSAVAPSSAFSNYALGSMVASAASLYLRGAITRDDHARETGLLAGEAALNSIIVAETMKGAFQRPRPNAAQAGTFGAGGNSFPSEHALAAWSIASVIAREYPGPLTKVLAYGAATGISLSRVAARQHFPSDVVVGSALGYLIGRYVYREHHDPELPGANVHSFMESLAQEPAPREHARRPAEFGSPSVPLDSWVYAALDRLAALGYAPSAYSNLRPWTRMECARIVAAAGEDLNLDHLHPDDLNLNDLNFDDLNHDNRRIANPAIDRRVAPNIGTHANAQSEAYRLHAALKSEFASELARW